MRGFFEVGIYHAKTRENIGTLWRTAYQLGAAGVFTVGARYRPQSSDTLKVPRHIPLRHFADMDALHAALPSSAPLVGVEMGGQSLGGFVHPQRAIYLLGAEDHGLPPDVIARCHAVVSLESIRAASYNVAVAGALVLYDRLFSGKTMKFADGTP